MKSKAWGMGIYCIKMFLFSLMEICFFPHGNLPKSLKKRAYCNAEKVSNLKSCVFHLSQINCKKGRKSRNVDPFNTTYHSLHLDILRSVNSF